MWQCQSCLCVWEAPRGELEPCDVVLENCIPSCCRRCVANQNRQGSEMPVAPTFATPTAAPIFLDAEEVFTKERIDASVY